MNCTCCTKCNPHLRDGLDADTRELLAYNKAAEQRACSHLHVRQMRERRDNGIIYTFTRCSDCYVLSPKSKSRPVGCTCEWMGGDEAEILSVDPSCPIHFYR